MWSEVRVKMARVWLSCCLTCRMKHPSIHPSNLSVVIFVVYSKQPNQKCSSLVDGRNEAQMKASCNWPNYSNTIKTANKRKNAVTQFCAATRFLLRRRNRNKSSHICSWPAHEKKGTSFGASVAGPDFHSSLQRPHLNSEAEERLKGENHSLNRDSKLLQTTKHQRSVS